MSSEEQVSLASIVPKAQLEENIDDKILAQQEAIEKEIAQNQPLVSEQFDVSVLSSEYLKEDSIYQKKVADLCTKYKYIRRTRGDGNCFFRAFAFRYFETLIGKTEEIEQFKTIVNNTANELVNLGGYCAFTVEDFRDVFVDVLNKLANNFTVNELKDTFCEPGTSDYIVVYLRLIVSCFLQKNSDFYENFIENYVTMKDFCSHEVEPMYRESDHIHLIAITQATNVPVRIIYMDRGDNDHVAMHDFPEESTPRFHILYRPGHYDILYEN